MNVWLYCNNSLNLETGSSLEDGSCKGIANLLLKFVKAFAVMGLLSCTLKLLFLTLIRNLSIMTESLSKYLFCLTMLNCRTHELGLNWDSCSQSPSNCATRTPLASCQLKGWPSTRAPSGGHSKFCKDFSLGECHMTTASNSWPKKPIPRSRTLYNQQSRVWLMDLVSSLLSEVLSSVLGLYLSQTLLTPVLAPWLLSAFLTLNCYICPCL